MGDARFQRPFERVRRATDRAAELRRMNDDDVVQALAAASRSADPLLANVLATEALNRMRHARVALANLGEGVCVLDMQERVLEANPAAVRMLGWAPDEIVGMQFHQHAGECRMMRGVSEGRAVHYEDEIFVRADKTTFPVAYTAAPIVHEGRVDGAVLVFSDITARRQAEERLIASETRLRALADATQECIIIHTDTRIVMANRAASALFGLSHDELTRRSLFQLIAPSSIDAVIEGIEDGRTDAMIVDCVRSDGSVFTAEARARPFEVGGTMARAVAMRDVTAEREAARRLEASEQRYRSLFESSPLPMFSLDAKGRMTGINPALERLTGFRQVDWNGIGFISLVEPLYAETAMRAFSKVLRGESNTQELQIVRVDGQALRVRVTAFPVRVGDAIDGIYGFVEELG